MSKQCKRCKALTKGWSGYGLCRSCSQTQVGLRQHQVKAVLRTGHTPNMQQPSLPRVKWLEKELPE